ncbi:MAG: hypothetical protein JKY71_07105 [Alphaproteobacteria bacterium]|nr:hypothetical protein [Alphaproteobacteria bacterium]
MMDNFDVSFLQTGASWSSDIITDLKFSFPDSTPAYADTFAEFRAKFDITDSGSAFTQNLDPLKTDQEDLMRFFLMDPQDLREYQGSNPINTSLINTANVSIDGENLETNGNLITI